MRALVLSGGATKGAYQIGVLKRWMGEQGTDYEILCGVSVGALNVAGLSQSPFGSPREAIDYMNRFWLERVSTPAIYRNWRPFGRVHALWRKSVYDSQPLRDLVASYLDLEKTRVCGRKVAVGAVCMETGEYYFGRESDPNFDKWVLASSSYPIFLEPIEINGQLWSDGGIRSITPLGEAIRLGATEIDVIMCNNPELKHPWTSSTKRAVPDQVLRAVEIMSDQILQNDLQLVGLKNDLTGRDPRHKHIKIRLVQPKHQLVSDPLVFDPIEIRRMIDVGYEEADDFITYE